MRRRSLALLTAVVSTLFAVPVLASTYYSNDTDIFLSGSGITVQMVAGSTVESISVSETAFTVTALFGQRFTVRAPGPHPRALNNDQGMPNCTLVSGNVELIVDGPLTITITPGAACPEKNTGNETNVGNTIQMFTPNGGESYHPGTSVNILWGTSGHDILNVRLLLSQDGGGTAPTLIAGDEINDGVYVWTVPSIPGTQLRVRAEAYGSAGTRLATDQSDANFTITSDAPPPTPPGQAPPPAPMPDSTLHGVYTPAAALSGTASINDDKQIGTATVPVNCTAGALIKGTSFSAVYYCGADGKRYVFPNEKTYRTWYNDFSGVITVPDATLGSIMIGGNVTYRPGTRMLKIQSDSRVYVIARGGTLRMVTSEIQAKSLYGDNWQMFVEDLPDAFWTNYSLGTSLNQ